MFLLKDRNWEILYACGKRRYKCDNLYNSAAEWGVSYKDPQLKIDWQLPFDDPIVSEKDLILPSFKDAVAKLFLD